MWLFDSKSSVKESGLFNGFVDWHCHILPGVDDGVRSIEESLDILSFYEKIGVREIWLTPHIMEDIPNTVEYLKERFAQLQSAYNGSIKMNLASENMLDVLFEERLEKNDFLPIGSNEDHLLVETSYFSPPIGLYDKIEKIKSKGYYPILAHPERYAYMDEKDYEKLHKMGVKFQLNLFSLTGGYGKPVQKKAEWLLKKRMYRFSGTDIHSYKAFLRMVEGKVKDKIIKMI